MARRRRGTHPLAHRHNGGSRPLPDFRGMADIGIEDPEMGSVWGGLKKVGKAVGRAAKKTGRAVGKVAKPKKLLRATLKVAKYTTPVGLAITAVKKRKAIGRTLKKGAKLGLKVAKYTTPVGLAITAVQKRKAIGRTLKKGAKLGLKVAKYTTPIGLNVVAGKKLLGTVKKAFGPKKVSKIQQPDGSTLDVEKKADELGVPEDAVRDAAIAANQAGDDPTARANAVDDVEQAYGLRDDALTEIAEDTHDPEGPNFYSTDPGDNESGDEAGARQDQAQDDVEESLVDEDLEGGHLDRESSSDRELEEADFDDDSDGGEDAGGDELEEPDEGASDDSGEAEEAAAMGGPFSVAGRRLDLRAGRPSRALRRARPVRMVAAWGGRPMQFHGMAGPFGFIKKGAKAVGRGAKAVGRGAKKAGKAVGKVAVKAGKPLAKVGLQVGRSAFERYTGLRLGGGGGGGGAVTAPEPGRMNPLVLAGGAAVVLGGLYFATKKKAA